MYKENFIKAFEKHKDSKFTIFMFTTFSRESKSKYKNLLDLFLIIMFCLMFLLGIIGLTGIFLNVICSIFIVVFFGFIGSFFYAAFAKNKNIRKVCKELKISIKEYETYYTLFVK